MSLQTTYECLPRLGIQPSWYRLLVEHAQISPPQSRLPWSDWPIFMSDISNSSISLAMLANYQSNLLGFLLLQSSFLFSNLLLQCQLFGRWCSSSFGLLFDLLLLYLLLLFLLRVVPRLLDIVVIVTVLIVPRHFRLGVDNHLLIEFFFYWTLMSDILLPALFSLQFTPVAHVCSIRLAALACVWWNEKKKKRIWMKNIFHFYTNR